MDKRKMTYLSIIALCLAFLYWVLTFTLLLFDFHFKNSPLINIMHCLRLPAAPLAFLISLFVLFKSKRNPEITKNNYIAEATSIIAGIATFIEIYNFLAVMAILHLKEMQ